MDEEATRSRQNVTPENFDLILELLINNAWLAKRKTQINHLYSTLSSPEEVSTVFELLHMAEHFGEERVYKAAEKISAHVSGSWKLSPSETCIVAEDLDSKRSSADVAIQAVRPRLHEADAGWKDNNIVGTLLDAAQNPKWKNVILIDDFIGTGRKIAEKITWINEKSAEVKLHNKKIYIVAFACHNFSFDRSAKLIEDFYVPNILKKSITDNYPEKVAKQKKANIKAISERFGCIGKKQHLGFGKTESLYFPENMNTPNNVFPIFWSRRHAGSKDFTPILLRMTADEE